MPGRAKTENHEGHNVKSGVVIVRRARDARGGKLENKDEKGPDLKGKVRMRSKEFQGRPFRGP